MWLYNAEILPASGISIATVLNWVGSILVGLITPVMIDEQPGPDWTFWIFAILNGVAFLFVLMCLKETKGKSKQEIDVLYSHN